MDKARLAEVFEIAESDLGDVLKGVKAAALEEYLAMVLGTHVPHGMRDLREYRLLLMTRTVFGGKVPSERTVGRLFHLTPAQSRALIAGTLATYRLELSDIVSNTIRDAVSGAKPDPDGDWLVIDADSQVASVINDLLASLHPMLPPVRRRAHTVGQYLMKPSAHERLRRHLGV